MELVAVSDLLVTTSLVTQCPGEIQSYVGDTPNQAGHQEMSQCTSKIGQSTTHSEKGLAGTLIIVMLHSVSKWQIMHIIPYMVEK